VDTNLNADGDFDSRVPQSEVEYGQFLVNAFKQSPEFHDVRVKNVMTARKRTGGAVAPKASETSQPVFNPTGW